MDKQQLKTLITTYKLSNKLLALKSGMAASSFYEKLNQPGQNFTPEQFKKITKFLTNMSKELAKIE